MLSASSKTRSELPDTAEIERFLRSHPLFVSVRDSFETGVEFLALGDVLRTQGDALHVVFSGELEAVNVCPQAYYHRRGGHDDVVVSSPPITKAAWPAAWSGKNLPTEPGPVRSAPSWSSSSSRSSSSSVRYPPTSSFLSRPPRPIRAVTRREWNIRKNGFSSLTPFGVGDSGQTRRRLQRVV